MNISTKVEHIVNAASYVENKIFSFTHDLNNYILDLSKDKMEMFLEKEYIDVKRKYKKLIKYNNKQAEKVLWVDEDGNSLGYGKKGKKLSLENAQKKIN